MRKRLFTQLLSLCFAGVFVTTGVEAQSDYTITSYLPNKELTQNTSTSIIQDRKGFMWLSTWDGLTKFDGYNFQNYKAHPGDKVELSNNRLIHVSEDCAGYIWVVCYDGKVSRFNPETESFEAVAIPNDFTAKTIQCFKSGHVWIKNGNNRTVRMTVDPLTHHVKADFQFQSDGDPRTEFISVHEDAPGNEWILATQSGLYLLSKGEDKVRRIRGSEDIGFHCYCETNNEVLLGADNGEVWHYSKIKQQFYTERVNATSKVKSIQRFDSLLVYATANDGFFVKDGTGRLDHYPNPGSDPTKRGIRNMYVDHNGLVWMETPSLSLTLFSLKERTFRHIPFKSGKKNTRESFGLRILEDEIGNEWVYPYFGELAYFKRGELTPFTELNKELEWNASDSHYRFYCDRQNNLWVSTSRWTGKISPRNPQYHRTLLNRSDSAKPEENTFRAICKTGDGQIWTGNKSGEIVIYTDDFRFVGKLTPQGGITSNPLERTTMGIAYAIEQDSKGRIWIGTKGEGLFRIIPVAANRYDIKQFKSDNKETYSVSSNQIYAIHEDKDHRLWIGTYEGGLNYLDESDPQHPRFIHYYNELKSYPIQDGDKIYSITSDNKGCLWVGSSNGILTASRPIGKPEDIRFRLHQRIPGDSCSLGSNNVQYLYHASDDQIYVASFGGGFSRAKWQTDSLITFTTYTSGNGLQSDIVFSIQEDNQKKLWMACGSGMSCYDLQTRTLSKWDEDQIGFQPVFNEGGALFTDKGEITFVSLTGLFHFRPSNIAKSDFVPSLVFTQLRLGDHTIQPLESEILPKHIDYMDRVRIPHEENYFTIRYATLEMAHPYSVQYAYKLEGFDNEWHQAGNQRSVTYTNLPTGKYTLLVRSTNGDGVWVDNLRKLEIEILPSFWETPLAWLIYILLLIGIGSFAAKVISTVYRLRNKVYIEQQLTDIKLQFFTNISHDLRTPLTLITAPIENLLQNKDVPPFVKEQLRLIKRNTDGILKLVNQILDFRKIQSHKMKLVVEELDIIPFISRVMTNFKALALERDIHFTFTHNMNQCFVWTDSDKLEKILFNLLSNAFKFTETGKQIEIRFNKDEKEYSIEVCDEGVGIPQHWQHDVFSRFTNYKDKTITGNPSTGIGLSIVKELVDLLRGTVTLTSHENQGSTFRLTFPLGKEHYVSGTEVIVQDRDSHAEQRSPQTAEGTADKQPEIPTLLIVEDNNDMRHFLRDIFSEQYQVLEASDGKAGLMTALKRVPDLIISDVMMPVMDGVELVSQLKSELSTSHIPVILLTAKSAIESQLSALKEGADDYITKPFSATYLKARVENLLEQRRKLQAIYCKKLLTVNPQHKEEEPTENFLSEQDKLFMNKLIDLTEENLGNSELTIDLLVRQFYMSRTSFYAKIKNITGLSPIEFVQQMRVKRAAEMIVENKYSIAEIANRVGFNDAHYFSRCFKKAYSVSPTEYFRRSKSGI